MSVAGPTLADVDLTILQRRTVRDLFGLGPGPDEASGRELAEWVAGRLDDRLAEVGLGAEAGQVRVWKSLVTDAGRCEGLFDAVRRREGPPFEHSPPTAAGTLFHKAIELDVLTRHRREAASMALLAAERLGEADRTFARYWGALGEIERAELLSQALARLTLFRSSFPPLERRWRPQPECAFRVSVGNGRVVLMGRADLVLGRRNRLAIDFKSGEARPEHAEDMRFYALLLALRLGVAPYRVATVFIDSGAWQAEDVSAEMLERACERVAAAVGAAIRLGRGEAPALRPGVWCAWCPRAPSCPVAASLPGGGQRGRAR